MHLTVFFIRSMVPKILFLRDTLWINIVYFPKWELRNIKLWIGKFLITNKIDDTDKNIVTEIIRDFTEILKYISEIPCDG